MTRSSRATRLGSEPRAGLRLPYVVAFLSHSSSIGGAELSLVNTLAYLDTAVVTPHVILPRRGPLEARLQAIGVPYSFATYQPWLATRNGLGPFAVRAGISVLGLAGLIRHIAQLKPALVWTNSLVTPQGSVVAALLHVPHVWQVREVIRLNPTMRSPLHGDWLLTFSARISARVVAVSEAARDQYPPRWRGRVKVIHNGIPDDFGAGWSSSTWSGTGEGPVLILVGVLSPVKRQTDAIVTLAILRERYPGIRLTLIGDGTARYRHELRDFARRQGVEHRVLFAGQIADPRIAMASGHIMLVPSVSESFGLTTVEALAIGMPIVAARAGATSEILARGGGVMVPPRRPDLMAAAVDDLLRSPKCMEELGRQGRVAARSFTISREAKAIQEEIVAIAEAADRHGG